MGLKEDIQRKIDRKQQELVEREATFKIERASALAYIQALQDLLKTLPRDASDVRSAEQVLRPGSGMAQAKDLISKAGKPLHIGELLRAMGRPVSKENRASLGGSISNYVRRGEVFIKTAPNTFGLIGMEQQAASKPPPGFGSVRVRSASLTEVSDELRDDADDNVPDDTPDDAPDLEDEDDQPF